MRVTHHIDSKVIQAKSVSSYNKFKIQNESFHIQYDGKKF